MNLEQEDWKSQLNNDGNAIIIDVRTEEEWSDGIIPGAMLLDIYKNEEFLSGIKSLEKTKNYYVYCKAGGRSQQACSIMNQHGIPNAYNLIGGITKWTGDRIKP